MSTDLVDSADRPVAQLDDRERSLTDRVPPLDGSPQMRAILRVIKNIADTDATVLIRGGKRRGEGSRRPGPSCCFGTPRWSVRQGQLRRDPFRAARIRALPVWRPAPAGTAAPARRKPTDATQQTETELKEKGGDGP